MEKKGKAIVGNGLMAKVASWTQSRGKAAAILLLVGTLAMGGCKPQEEQEPNNEQIEELKNYFLDFVAVCGDTHGHIGFQSALDCLSQYVDENMDKKEVSIMGFMRKSELTNSVDKIMLGKLKVTEANNAFPIRKRVSRFVEEGSPQTGFEIVVKYEKE